MPGPSNRLADQPAVKASLFSSVLSLLGVLAMMILNFMREDDAELLRRIEKVQTAQAVIAIEQASVVTEVKGLMENSKKSNRAVEILSAMVIENQRLAITADERSKNNVERIRELRN